MSVFKKAALICTSVILFGTSSMMAYAEAPAALPLSSLSETIAHVEQGLAEVQKSDFAAANLHLKAAVESSEKIVGNEAVVKEARANVVQGNIQSKQGEVEKSSEFLNKALTLYKSI